MRCEKWKLITNLPAFVTIISVPRAKKSSHKFFISMSTFTFAKEQDNGLVGGVEEVEHRSSNLRVKSWSDLVSLLIVGEFSGVETFFPVPAFRSLSKQWKENQAVISDIYEVRADISTLSPSISFVSLKESQLNIIGAFVCRLLMFMNSGSCEASIKCAIENAFALGDSRPDRSI